MARILVVDDEEGIRKILQQVLEYEGHEVRTAGGGGEALSLYSEFRPDLTFLDVKMARMDGLEVLDRIRAEDEAAVVVMISGHGNIETAVEATRRGAYDFLEKPLDTDRLLVTTRNALQHRGLERENARLRGEVESHYEIVGRSFAIRLASPPHCVRPALLRRPSICAVHPQWRDLSMPVGGARIAVKDLRIG